MKKILKFIRTAWGRIWNTKKNKFITGCDFGYGKDYSNIIMKGDKVMVTLNPKSNWMDEYFRHPDDVRELRIEREKIKNIMNYSENFDKGWKRIHDQLERDSKKVEEKRIEKAMESVKDFLKQ